MQTHKNTDAVIGFNCNQISVEALFEKYAQIGFLYPSKMEMLRPYFEQIQDNWERLLLNEDQLLWVLTNMDRQNFASIAVIQHANHGLMAQHLVSDGNPRLSLQLMAEAQHLVERIAENEMIRSSQNWFRPNNRYAFRIFASMYDKLGSEKASLLSFKYLKQPFSAIQGVRPHYPVTEVTTVDEALIRFVSQQYNQVFCEGEELTTPDLTFSALSKKFRALGLQKGRKIIKLTDPISKEILACVIANRAPIGLNFSFLENRAYFIVDQSLPSSTRAKICLTLSQSIKAYYQNFELRAIPIATDELSSDTLQGQGAEYLRTYMQSIWLQSGFAQWRAHIESFLARIGRR